MKEHRLIHFSGPETGGGPEQNESQDAPQTIEEHEDFDALKRSIDDLRGQSRSEQSEKATGLKNRLQTMANAVVTAASDADRPAVVTSVIAKLTEMGIHAESADGLTVQVSQIFSAEAHTDEGEAVNETHLTVLDRADVSPGDRSDVNRVLRTMDAGDIGRLAGLVTNLLDTAGAQLPAIVAAYKQTLVSGADMSAIFEALDPEVKSAVESIINSDEMRKFFGRMDAPPVEEESMEDMIGSMGESIANFAEGMAPMLEKFMAMFKKFQLMFDDIKAGMDGSPRLVDSSIDSEIENIDTKFKGKPTERAARLQHYKNVTLKEYETTTVRIDSIGDETKGEIGVLTTALAENSELTTEQKTEHQQLILDLKQEKKDFEERKVYLRGRLDNINAKTPGGDSEADIKKMEDERNERIAREEADKKTDANEHLQDAEKKGVKGARSTPGKWFGPVAVEGFDSFNYIKLGDTYYAESVDKTHLYKYEGGEDEGFVKLPGKYFDRDDNTVKDGTQEAAEEREQSEKDYTKGLGLITEYKYGRYKFKANPVKGEGKDRVWRLDIKGQAKDNLDVKFKDGEWQYSDQNEEIYTSLDTEAKHYDDGEGDDDWGETAETQVNHFRQYMIDGLKETEETT